MLSNQYLEAILDYGASKGADYVEVFYEETAKNILTVIGERVANCSYGTDCGVGIRLFFGNEVLYFHSADSQEKIVFAMMKQQLETYQNARKTNVDQSVIQSLNLHNDYRIAPSDWSMDQKMKLVQKAIHAGKAVDSRIVQGKVHYIDFDQKVQIANTLGQNMSDHRIKTRMLFTMFAEDESDAQSSYYGPGAMKGLEFYQQIDVEECARKAARGALNLLHARPCPIGQMPVVIGNGFGGLFFHEACGHSLEASQVRNNGSEFSNLLGKQVASSKVTLIDDGSILGEWGSLSCDDEGERTRKNVLIENGVLKNYLVDRYHAQLLGLEPTGSARRENYRFAPTSRMTNTYIAPGEDSFEDMIASVEKGIYVKSINAGSVNSATGEFNFNTGETFLIENGIIQCPVRSATLIGRGGDILKKVEMVGNDYQMGQGFCYAKSGALFIGAGQPSVKVSKMTVGGGEA